VNVGVIVPVKPLSLGKSRLAGVLTPEQRAELNRRLFLHTLDVLNDSPGLSHVLVISQDQAVLALANECGAHIVQENGTSQLNAALNQATRDACNLNLDALLVLPADLPLLTTEDIRALLTSVKEPPQVVIAPDHHNLGTNALLVSPPGLIAYNFGMHSFEKHCQSAHSAAARLEIVQRPSLALDIDLPEDLDRVGHPLINQLLSMLA
jgi:2-phospho-L-lactate guanylyltransferase